MTARRLLQLLGLSVVAACGAAAVLLATAPRPPADYREAVQRTLIRRGVTVSRLSVDVCPAGPVSVQACRLVT
jgi:hypothetical protein